MEKKYYIYSYWTACGKVIEDKRCSIIPSIATLRCSTDDPITVVDYSLADWEHYPSQLGFTVVRKRPYLAGHRELTEFRLNTLSRTFDTLIEAEKCPGMQVVAVDADVFWLGCVEECCRTINFRKFRYSVNTGCYQMSPGCDFVNHVKEFTERSIADIEFRKHMQDRCHYPWFNDELVFSYAYQEFPDLVSPDVFRYNTVLQGLLRTPEASFEIPKNLHIIRGSVPNDLYDKRGVCAVIIREIRERLVSVPRFLELFGDCEVLPLRELVASGANQFYRRLYSCCG